MQILASILANYIVIMHRYFHKLFGSFVDSFHRFDTFQFIEFEVQTCCVISRDLSNLMILFSMMRRTTGKLQVIENVFWSKLCIYFFFQASTNEIGQFVSIPTSKSKSFMKVQYNDFFFFLERQHNVTFHPRGILRHHWFLMFTF